MHRTEARLRMGLLNTEPNNVKPLNDTRSVSENLLVKGNNADISIQSGTEWCNDISRSIPFSSGSRLGGRGIISVES